MVNAQDKRMLDVKAMDIFNPALETRRLHFSPVVTVKAFHLDSSILCRETNEPH